MNKPFVGAIVLVDTKNSPVYTDKNGFYKVKVKPNTEIISVYTKTNLYSEKSYEGQSTINFLFSDIIDSEYTITDAFNTKESSNMDISKIISKNTANVSNSDFLSVSDNDNTQYNNIYEMIQNRVPGVLVEGKKILIRGMNRMNLGNVDNSPLFVVEGMPVNSIDHIIPEQVNSITFLKGSSSTKYGSRGVNGVIVIELKKVNKPL
jgi:TonB-dependent starch-binding outer membrane protein SusC